MPRLQPLATLAATTTLTLLATTARGEAEPALFEHATGITATAFAMHGANSDDTAVDFDHGQYGGLQLGFRFSTGTELLVLGGTSPNIGHERIAYTFGAGVRQRIRLGKFEPFVEATYSYVGDEADSPWALGAGAGIDLRLRRDLAIGLAGGHYFSEDSDELGALDWFGRAQVTWRLGR